MAAVYMIYFENELIGSSETFGQELLDPQMRNRQYSAVVKVGDIQVFIRFLPFDF